MPRLYRAAPPRKYCPVCGKQIWSNADLGFKPVWEWWTTHIYRIHPVFAKWYRKIRILFWLSILPAFLPLTTAVVVLGVVPLELGRIIAGLSLLIWLLWMFTVWELRKKGESRFRALWKEEHPMESVSSGMEVGMEGEGTNPSDRQ